MSKLALFASILALANAFPRPDAAMSMPYESEAPIEHVVLLGPDHQAPHHIHTVLAELQLTPDHDDVLHVYNNSAFKGFALYADRQRCSSLANMSSVAVLEKNAKVHKSVLTRSPAPWGLERISLGTAGSSQIGLNSSYSYNNVTLGKGVDIYMIDTGLYTENVDFGGRATMAWPNSSIVGTDGHGTHTAGTAGSDTYGGASAANLIGVQALPDGTGSVALMVATINFVIHSHNVKKSNGSLVGSVMSMSLSMPDGVISDALDTAVNAAVGQGIHTVMAAGNHHADACKVSPSAVGGVNGSAISVGSIGYANAVSWFSNTGPCVDVYAPGEQVLSTWINATDATHYLDGTSMSTPHVTGIVATQIAANASLAQNPAAMKAWLKSNALRGLVGGKVIASGQELLLANNGVQVSPEMESQRLRLAAVAVNTKRSHSQP